MRLGTRRLLIRLPRLRKFFLALRNRRYIESTSIWIPLLSEEDEDDSPFDDESEFILSLLIEARLPVERERYSSKIGVVDRKLPLPCDDD
jgi:hypothetical protein